MGFFSDLGDKYQHIRHNHRYGFVLRYVTIVVGVLVTAVGVVTIPYPGPGWAIVFLGLLILSQELEWAARLRAWIMGKLKGFYKDYVDGRPVAQAALWIGTCAIVLATLWLTNFAHTVAGWVGIHWSWLQSPLFS